MNGVGLHKALGAAIAAVLLCAAGGADARERWHGGLAGKIEYCKTCHGIRAQGYLG